MSRLRYALCLDIEAAPGWFSHEVVQLGAVALDLVTGAEVFAYSSFVRMARSGKLSSPLRALTGITQAAVDEAPSFASVWCELASRMAAAGVDAGNSLPFTYSTTDLEMFVPHSARLAGVAMDPYWWRFVDVQRAVGAYFGLWRLASLANALRALELGIPGERLHDALTDARATGAVLLELVRRGFRPHRSAQWVGCRGPYLPPMVFSSSLVPPSRDSMSCLAMYVGTPVPRKVVRRRSAQRPR